MRACVRVDVVASARRGYYCGAKDAKTDERAIDDADGWADDGVAQRGGAWEFG